MCAKEAEEMQTWRLATIIVVILAVVVFFVQHAIGPIFDVVFEICIFYIPAFTLIGIFLYLKAKHA